MSDLTKVSHVLDSREVAKMVGMRHADLMRNISHYVDVISTNAKLRSLDFFIERDYIDKKGESRKRYDITKKGCEMVANKLTGEKGILFTAEYVERFNQMEEADRQPKELTGRELMAKALLEAQAVLAEKDTTIAKQTQLIGDEYAVHCIHCGAYGASAKTVEWAVALWNQRPGEPLKL